MSKFQKRLKKIPKAVQAAALVEINKARVLLGGKPLAELNVQAANTLGLGNPLGRNIQDCLTPVYADGNGGVEITGTYGTCWEVPDKRLGELLAAAWQTEYCWRKMTTYCCYRHFDEGNWVVMLPEALLAYEEAVFDAAEDCE